MKITVEYDGIPYTKETKDTSLFVTWHEALRVFFKLLKKHKFVIKNVKSLVKVCADANDTYIADRNPVYVNTNHSVGRCKI
jgi:ferritin